MAHGRLPVASSSSQLGLAIANLVTILHRHDSPPPGSRPCLPSFILCKVPTYLSTILIEDGRPAKAPASAEPGEETMCQSCHCSSSASRPPRLGLASSSVRQAPGGACRRE